MEWSVQRIAQLTGTTSRTLRHYDQIGLLPPSRIGSNGYRYYDERALVRLQRILLLRELGLSLAHITNILTNNGEEVPALTTHLNVLYEERKRISRQIDAVKHTIDRLKRKEALMPDTMFDGFDHTQHQAEVEARWGNKAYTQSAAWWEQQSPQERSDWKEQLASLNEDWKHAAQDPSITPESAQAQQLAARHVAWLQSVPGTPAAEPGGDLHGYVLGLAEMYVSDERFAVNYGGVSGAAFVRDALLAHIRTRA